jgi:hypothetical protein
MRQQRRSSSLYQAPRRSRLRRRPLPLRLRQHRQMTNNVDALIEILGPSGEDLVNTREIVKEMELLNPDEIWRPVEEER